MPRAISFAIAIAIAIAMMGVASIAGAQSPPQELHFTISRQLPLIHARIDGAEATLILDLGGAAALALRPDWPGTRPDNEEVARQVELDGAAALPLASRVWRRAAIPAGVDGYVGYGYLKQFSIVINYGRQTLRLLPVGKLAPECGTDKQPLFHLGSLMYVRFEHLGQPLQLGLDTGANQNVLRSGGAGALQTLEGITLGTQPVQPGPFRAIDLPVPKLDGILGYDFFSRYQVCVDAGSDMFAIRPAGDATR